MLYLIDTNVLLRSAHLSHPMNSDAVNAINTLLSRSESLHIVPQNLIELSFGMFIHVRWTEMD